MVSVILLVIIAIFFIIAGALELLWNTTMPDIFDLKEISYWQSFRLILISTILFSPAMVNFGA